MMWNHHIPLILDLEPIKGFFIPECTLNEIKSPRSKYLFKIPNKGYKNFAYLIHGTLTNTTQTCVDKDGNSVSVEPSWLLITRLNIGSSSNPHDVTRYELYSRYFSTGIFGVHWLSEAIDKTSLIAFFRYSIPPPDKAVGEVGLYWHYFKGTTASYAFQYTFLIARAIIDPSVTKYAGTLYEEGWQIDFPSNYTRWGLRSIFELPYYYGGDFGSLLIDVNGSPFSLRQRSPFTGTLDLMIGSDNTPPSPTDYALKSPIGSLSSQSQSVEIDTTLQECRIVRTGTFTPSTNVTLGEVALFINVYDATGASRKIMVARGVWDTPVTLIAGTTYTIGIALRLG
jgi:hypothetical protein